MEAIHTVGVRASVPRAWSRSFLADGHGGTCRVEGLLLQRGAAPLGAGWLRLSALVGGTVGETGKDNGRRECSGIDDFGDEGLVEGDPNWLEAGRL